ncbi:MAG: hypothetical protein EOO60_11645 [Hymenobacter sp.]|nr:MAG: hypothetical protein EOO60_11645 [Hymenobacter sp.]
MDGDVVAQDRHGGHAIPRNPAAQSAPSAAQLYEWAGKYLRDNRNAPREFRLELINWRHNYQSYQEAAELKANPVAEEELRRIAERLARKAQSGFAGFDIDQATASLRISS